MLAREDGTPIYGDFTDEQILADVPAHKRAVMRPLLKSPEFCATCHKVDAPPSLNKYKHIRGFSAYDEWQQSGASHESVSPFYTRAERADCRACHMPKVESANDRAAKQGRIASHRWLGANTAAPLFYEQKKQVELTESFLKMDVLEVDIFAIKREATNELIAPLSPSKENSFTPLPGEEMVVEVVVSNRNAAQSVTIPSVGQAANLTFSVPGNQQVTIHIRNLAIGPFNAPSTLTLSTQGGTQIFTQTINSNADYDIPRTLSAGTYVLKVDPQQEYTGSLSINLTTP